MNNQLQSLLNKINSQNWNIEVYETNEEETYPIVKATINGERFEISYSVKTEKYNVQDGSGMCKRGKTFRVVSSYINNTLKASGKI